MEDNKLLIFCQYGPRLVASLNLDGNLVRLASDYDLSPFEEAFLKFAEKFSEKTAEN